MSKSKSKIRKHKTKEADYIVIGMGAAGCLVANILSVKNSVIGLESGDNVTFSKPIIDSVYAGIEFGLEENFSPLYLYQQTPVRNGCLINPGKSPVQVKCTRIADPEDDDGSKIKQPEKVGIYTTGRVLGGGSSINGEQYVRGSPAFYDLWNKIVSPLWSSDAAIRRFKQIEKYNGKTTSSDDHGYSGTLDIRQAPVESVDMSAKFAKAVRKARIGVKEIILDDYNNPSTPVGSFTKWELFQAPDGKRASSAIAFLGPSVMMPKGKPTGERKLRIYLKTTALRILWDGLHNSHPLAIGVRTLRKGKSTTFYARKEVILCTGIYSAELLQRSGVGPAPLLKCLGIPLIHANEHVGLHLKNHLLVPIMFSANPKDEGTPKIDPNALYTGGAFLPALLPEDLKLSDRRGYQLIGASPAPGSFMILLIYLQPHSEGKVVIQSSDPLQTSLVDNNYFGDPLDLKAYILAIRNYIVPIAKQLNKIDSSYVLQSPSLDVIADDDKLTNYIFESFDHSHHWHSSCRMESKLGDGVVDDKGKVLGVENVRVADVSICPTSPDGNTCATAYLIASAISESILGYA